MGRIQNDLSTVHDALTVTPSDTTVLPAGVRALWIGGAGDVTVRFAATRRVVEYAAVPAGRHLVQVDQVLAATTATDILAEY